MLIKGTVEEIIYRNNDNGYTIIALSSNNIMLTATGKFPLIGEGEDVELEGEMKLNPKYGEQFEVSHIKINKPSSIDAIVKYLASGLISGVGEITASNIVKRFGEKTLDVIENNPSSLAEIRGISERKALAISESYADIKKMQDAVMFLQNYEVSVNMAVKIYNKYKQATETIVSTNPYKLVEDIDGIGFRTADKLAFKIGIDTESEFRMRAGIIYVLSEISSRNGSTVAKIEEVYTEVCILLGFGENGERTLFDNVLSQLIIEGKIKECKIDGADALSNAEYYNMEKTISARIIKMLRMGDAKAYNVEAEIEEFERINAITLHDIQKDALRLAGSKSVCIITGGPGTGKTTIIKGLLKIFTSRGLFVSLMAPTGRAAKRLSEATGCEAKTIHRALDFNLSRGANSFNVNEENKLDTDVLIVDEASMIDDFVMSNLLKALKSSSRLIIVGDKDQLPSVGAGNVLADLITSGLIPVSELTQIYRQANESRIVVNAHKINNSEMPDLKEKNNDFFFSYADTPEKAKNDILSLVSERIPQYLDIEPSKIQVIAPMKAGLAGVDNLNLELQETLNPFEEKKHQVILHKRIFRVGDRVMQTSNNYDQEWLLSKNGISVKGSGVFNGDIGIVEDVNTYTCEVSVVFEDGRFASYSQAELEDLSLAYAITIHKSQGSEFDVVIIPVLGGNPLLYNKNLLYTAVTRAKKMVVIVGNPKNIYAMVKNVQMASRNTLLVDFLHADNDNFNDMFE
ncbi:MAG: ATP-dependent RecD-like DNA helicase [Clostridia bacterium]